MSETPYVLVVHGTWNPPNRDAPRWHQSGSQDPLNFCNQLEKALARKGIAGAVWRKWSDESPGFGWTGANKHADRIAAAERLFAKLLEIRNNDISSRVHIVAHSHGCNVTLRAVQRYLEHLGDEADSLFNEATALCATKMPDEAVNEAALKVLGARVRANDDIESLRLLKALLTDLKRAGLKDLNRTISGVSA